MSSLWLARSLGLLCFKAVVIVDVFCCTVLKQKLGLNLALSLYVLNWSRWPINSQNHIPLGFHRIGVPLVEGLGDSPTTWKIGLSPIPLLCPKKHCFCNFHAVFSDFGQDLHPTEGSLVGNPGLIPIVMNRTSPTSSHSNITWVGP